MGSELYKMQLRRDALVDICADFGSESYECRTSMDIYNMQLAAVQRSLIIDRWGTVVVGIVLLFGFLWFLKKLALW